MNPKIYKAVRNTFGTSEIDLFDSRIKRQAAKYVSWKPEPEAFAVDAFSLNWNHQFMYILLPFSPLTKVIKKICRDQATGILVFPSWATQSWYPQALERSGKVPLKISPNLTNFILPHDKAAVHPLAEKLTLQQNSTLWRIKVGLPPSKKNCVICFIESPLKMMKNAFYFILKALFFLKIFKFLS